MLALGEENLYEKQTGCLGTHSFSTSLVLLADKALLYLLLQAGKDGGGRYLKHRLAYMGSGSLYMQQKEMGGSLLQQTWWERGRGKGGGCLGVKDLKWP